MDKKVRILLIEDNEDHALLFQKAIEAILNKGFTLEWKKDADETLQAIESGSFDSPDIIFLDLTLPGKGGFALLEEVKKHQQLSAIPVVIYTSSSRRQDYHRAQQLNAAGYITKPIFIDSLAKELKRIPVLVDLIQSKRKRT